MALLAAGLCAKPASAETKTYVVEWFVGATYNQEGDCADGMNPDMDHQYRIDLALVGYTKEQIDDILENLDGGGPKAQASREAITNRGRIDGKPVNAFTNPAAVPDPHIKSLTGKFAYGFNLDGKGAASPNSFEEPDTHEKGVNNELFRAFGCYSQWRSAPGERSVLWTFDWDVMRPSVPAWLITLSGNDLSKDGDATITFDRALEHVTRDTNGDVQRDMTFRIDPSPRSHNVFPAKIKNGVVTVASPDELHLLGDMLLYANLKLEKFHLRMTLNKDGSLRGIIGGYQPWRDIFVMVDGGGLAESNLGTDVPGMYYLLQRLADADPDPKTGRNSAISTAYRLDAVPAFIVTPPGENKTAATP